MLIWYITKGVIVLSKHDSKPKPKPKLPVLKPCPNPNCDCDKKKRNQPSMGREGPTSVTCDCGYGTINLYPQPGESLRERKIRSSLEWNSGKVYDPVTREKMNDKARKEYKKQKALLKKQRKQQKKHQKSNPER